MDIIDLVATAPGPLAYPSRGTRPPSLSKPQRSAQYKIDERVWGSKTHILGRTLISGQSGIYVVYNAPENSKTERGGLNLVDPEK